jgi:hypothetical protein
VLLYRVNDLAGFTTVAPMKDDAEVLLHKRPSCQRATCCVLLRPFVAMGTTRCIPGQDRTHIHVGCMPQPRAEVVSQGAVHVRTGLKCLADAQHLHYTPRVAHTVKSTHVPEWVGFKQLDGFSQPSLISGLHALSICTNTSQHCSDLPASSPWPAPRPPPPPPSPPLRAPLTWLISGVSPSRIAPRILSMCSAGEPSR